MLWAHLVPARNLANNRARRVRFRNNPPVASENLDFIVFCSPSICCRTIEHLEESIAAFDARIQAALAPLHDIIERLTEIPGIGVTAVQIIIAEIGADMSRFPTAGNLLSWAGLVPRLDESAGKRRSNSDQEGRSWLKPVLVQCAWAAARKKVAGVYSIELSPSDSRASSGSSARPGRASLRTALAAIIAWFSAKVSWFFSISPRS